MSAPIEAALAALKRNLDLGLGTWGQLDAAQLGQYNQRMRMIHRGLSFFLFALLLAPWPRAEGRVFDFKKEHFATYFRGNGATTVIGKSAYGKSSGTSTSFSIEPAYTYGGEFGVLFTSGKFGLRVGIEAINPKKVDGAEGKDSSGALLMSMTSQIASYGPAVHIEIGAVTTNTTKLLIVGGAGIGNLTMTNSYSLTAAGSAAYPGVADFTEEGKGTAYTSDLGVAYEFSMVDNVTMVLDLGYRYFFVPKLTHERAATTFLGAVAVGDTVRNSDGTNRSLNLSGPFAGLAFRFYVGL